MTETIVNGGVAKSVWIVDSLGNPLAFSTIAGNVNLNQINGVAVSNTNPLFSDLVRLNGVAISTANPVPISEPPYPLGAVPITATSGNVGAATATATLAATSGKTTYITGFDVTGTGASAALAVSVTVTGVITGTLTYTYAAVAGVAVENTPLMRSFPYPIPASGTNVTIVVSCPTLGSGNTNNTVNAYGFIL